ncbi:RNA-directed DNA polymerase, eukaryota, reverse transcriptase zinc-binding domain protein, partial [Tanacetum coccineum]
WNEALLCKHLWNIIDNKDSLWVKWVNMVKLKGKSIWEVQSENKDSGTWKAILNLRCPLCDLIPFRSRYEARLDEKTKVADMIVNNEWAWPDDWKTKFCSITRIKVPTLKDGNTDYAIWKDNNDRNDKFSIRKIWEKFKDVKDEVKWHKVVRFSQCNPRHAFILWLTIQRRLPTQDRLMAWNKNVQLICPLCNSENDSHDHLFFNCDYSKDVWRQIKSKLKEPNWNSNWENVIEAIVNYGCRNTIKSIIQRISIATAIYYIWNERNKRIFTQEQRNSQCLFNGIEENIKLQLLNLKVKKSLAVMKAITMFESLYLRVDLGNVAKWEEPFMECEWGYNLHNDALSCQGYAIMESEGMVSFVRVLFYSDRHIGDIG